MRDVGQAHVVVAGIGPQLLKGLPHVEPTLLGQHALGLLDDDAARQCALQLPDELVIAVDGPFLEQTDGGDVGQGLSDVALFVGQGSRAGAEQVERAPIVVSRNRIGKACTATYPSASATGANTGQRPTSAAKLSTATA